MQTRDFCFWLQGLLEAGKIETLDADQVALIKAHLDLVFKHDVSIKTKEMEHAVPVKSYPGAAPVDLDYWRQVAPYGPGLVTTTC